MRRRDLVDYPHRHRRALIAAVITILVLGLGLGGAVGTAFSRAFDSVNLDHFARQFKGS